VRLGVDDRLGRTLATKPDSLVALNWSDLYLNLRKQVPHEVYHAGRRVVALEAGEGEQPRLRLEDGAKEDFDLSHFRGRLQFSGSPLCFARNETDLSRLRALERRAGPEAAQRWRTRPRACKSFG
jgi:leucyl aminopeptidase (aminopeptidase T)